MKIFVIIINFLLLLLIIGSPILLLVVLKKTNLKYYHITYFLTSLWILVVVVLIFAWWTDKSNIILLEHYGCNIYGMSDTERYCKVLPEDMEQVKRMEISMMGIGWPLKAIFGIVILSPFFLLYLFAVLFAGYFWEKLLKIIKNKKNGV